MVATWTADTISGFGLSLAISQLIEVSNIAIPTLDIALAIRIAANAGLPNTPQREAGAEPFGAAVDGMVNGFDRNWKAKASSLLPLRKIGNGAASPPPD